MYIGGITGVTEEGLLMLKGLKDINSNIIGEKEKHNNTEVIGVTDSVSKLQEELIEMLQKRCSNK